MFLSYRRDNLTTSQECMAILKIDALNLKNLGIFLFVVSLCKFVHELYQIEGPWARRFKINRYLVHG